MRSIYEQKADPEILKECEEFVKNYKDTVNDKEIGREAIHKAYALSISLANCDDLKEMNEEVRSRKIKILLENEDSFYLINRLEKEINKIESSYRLDAQANKVLKELKEIQNKNWK